MRLLTETGSRRDMLGLDDQAALGRYAEAGDPAAFEVLAARYQTMVLATCRRTLGNEADAEDAAQETFLKLARSAGTIRSNAASWLHACALGTSRDLIRRSQTRRRAEQVASAVHQQRREEAVPSEDTILWRDVEPLVDAALADLDDDDRAVIVARFLAGRSQAELAREAGVPDGTMHRRIRRALDRLRTKLVARGLAVGAPGALSSAFAQAPLVSATPQFATALAKIGLAGIAGGAASGGLVSTAVVAWVLLGGALLGLAAYIPGVIWPPPPVSAPELLVADGVALERPTGRGVAMQVVSGAYATFDEGSVEISEDQIVLTLRKDPVTGVVGTVLFDIVDADLSRKRPVLDTVVNRVDPLPGHRARFKAGQSVPIAVWFDEFDRLVLEPLVDNAQFGRNEPKWFGLRPPVGWDAYKRIPEDSGELGILGPWVACERWPARITRDEIIFGARSWTAQRYRILEWYETDGCSEVVARYVAGYDRNLIGTEFRILIRESLGGYTLAFYPADVVEPGEWPTSFTYSEENPVQVFGLAFE